MLFVYCLFVYLESVSAGVLDGHHGGAGAQFALGVDIDVVTTEETSDSLGNIEPRTGH